MHTPALNNEKDLYEVKCHIRAQCGPPVLIGVHSLSQNSIAYFSVHLYPLDILIKIFVEFCKESAHENEKINLLLILWINSKLRKFKTA